MLKCLYAAMFILIMFVPDQNTSKAGKNVVSPSTSPESLEYKLLATNKTSTMQKELNEAADAGFRFETLMGGETAFGGSEAVIIMSRTSSSTPIKHCEYKLLATSKTSTMQKELQQAGDAGFDYKGQTVFSSAFGGREVVLVLERDAEAKPIPYEYKLLATNKTSTMQKELQQAANAGYRLLGLTVASTGFGGKELIAITRKLIP